MPDDPEVRMMQHRRDVQRLDDRNAVRWAVRTAVQVHRDILDGVMSAAVPV
jgi:hypothetical protein